MRLIIDGTQIQNEKNLHDFMAKNLNFGLYYGHNLAALRDRLAHDVERPLDIIWKNSKISQQNLGEDLFNRIIEIFRFIEKQDKSFNWSECFTFSIE